jgi:hypothetical protein
MVAGYKRVSAYDWATAHSSPRPLFLAQVPQGIPCSTQHIRPSVRRRIDSAMEAHFLPHFDLATLTNFVVRAF